MTERRSPGTRLRRPACGVVLALSVLCGCAEPPQVEITLRPVRSEEVRLTSDSRVRTFAGVAKAGLESRLSFRVPGTIERVPVVVGQRVRRGGILATLDPTDYELQVQEALAGLAQAEASQRNAEADYDRVRGLYENNNASRRELDGARASSESAVALVEAASKRLEQSRRQLSYCQLRAPVDGIVASSTAEVNENVQAGERLFLLTAGAQIEVLVALPEVLISDVTLGQEVEVAFDALPERRFVATVTEAGAAAVGSATTFPVVAQLTDSDPNIRSGMAAEASFRFGAKDGRAMLVPAVAVGEDREGRFVFVLEDSGEGLGVARRRAVEVGELTGDGIEILGGLTAGEQIVTAGVRRLSDGEEVLVQGGAP